MQYPNLFKRIIPFFVALALGLFVASFFISLTPTFRFRGRSFNKRHELKQENIRLKIEIENLKKEIERNQSSDWDTDHVYQDLLDRRIEDAKLKSKAEKEVERELKNRLERSEKVK
jgi:hypothetical protein